MAKQNHRGTIRRRGESWQADFGTVNGKRRMKSCARKAAAETWLQEQNILLQNQGAAAFQMTEPQRRDAMQAMEVLIGKATLTEAARFFMSHNNPDGGTVTTAEAIEKFLESRAEKNLRSVTIGDYRAKLSPFARDMDGRPLCHITLAIVEDWLRKGEYTVGTRKSYLRALGAFFQWAVKRRYMAENVARSIDTPREDRNAVTFLPVEDAEKLLRVAVAELPALLPYVAISMFAGLRPSEIHGEKTEHAPLDWRKIDLARKIITLDAKQTKTRDGRRVEMSENLVRWLLPYRRDDGPIYFTRSAIASLIGKAKIDFPKDVLRHTCGTYAYAAKKHEGEVAIMLGDTIKTVKKHYINPMVEEAEATKFWAIVPAAEEGNVVAFKSA